MQIIRRFLAKEIPEIEVTEYDPEQRGPPPHAFDWSEYEAVLMEQELGVMGSGLEWLGKYGSSPNFPAVILITMKNDPQLTADALKAGAYSVINKRDINPADLAKTVREAAVAEAAPKQDARTMSDAQIVEQARVGIGAGAGYKFGRLIGQGAMSRVYLAERIEDGLTVVLKIMDGTLADNDESVKRFILEASLVQEIDSPYVVKVFEQGFTNQYGFMSMEFFSRGDLKQRIEHGIVPDAAYAYILNIAYGLDVIRKVGIVHRDLKPANIMFRGDDGLAIADFGISKRVDQTSELTAVGAVLGTPYYMSPEQIRTQPADHRADLYSAGIILYEILTGEKPFDGRSLTEVVLKHLQDECPPLPAELSRFQPVLERLIVKEPEGRYQTATELITALEAMG